MSLTGYDMVLPQSKRSSPCSPCLERPNTETTEPHVTSVLNLFEARRTQRGCGRKGDSSRRMTKLIIEDYRVILDISRLTDSVIGLQLQSFARLEGTLGGPQG